MEYLNILHLFFMLTIADILKQIKTKIAFALVKPYVFRAYQIKAYILLLQNYVNQSQRESKCSILCL